jgi:hypothetical protein
MSNRRFEMFTIRQILVRMRQGDTSLSDGEAQVVRRLVRPFYCMQNATLPELRDGFLKAVRNLRTLLKGEWPCNV